VVDHSLEEFQRNQAHGISHEIIMQSGQNEQRMQANWREQWETAHGNLIALLRTLDKDYDESCEKSNHPLEDFTDNDLSYLIQARLRSLMDVIKGGEQSVDAQEYQLRIDNLVKHTALLEGENGELKEEIKSIRIENESLVAHLSALHQVQITSVKIDQAGICEDKIPVIENEKTLPKWFSIWRSSKGFERSSIAILVMGETGQALRPSITREMARRLSLSVDNHSLDEAINRILTSEENIHPAFMEKIEAIPEKGSSSGGNHPDVLRLTPDGKLVYQILSGKVSMENEYERLIRFHSSPEHTILNMQAVEILNEAGYRIQGQVQEIQLFDGSTYIPDIYVVDPKTGELLFIEVERDTKKDYLARKQKWMKQYEASNGSSCMFSVII
jgi:hypothetical protein